MKEIEKKNWVSNFTLVGLPKVTDYTFVIDKKSEKSAWIYNSMNLGVDCGEKCGVVYAEMMGGYSDERENKIYAHGKKEDGSDDWNTQVIVDWEDRNNPDILDTIGRGSFITVAMEHKMDGSLFYNRFLSAYDAIAYVQEHISEDTPIVVSGSLKHSEYNGKVQVRKTINRITLSKAKDNTEYEARFTQSVLINSDSVDFKNIDKDKGVVFVNAKVLDYLKEKDGVEIKSQYPYEKEFEFKYPRLTPEIVKKLNEMLFKVRRGYTQITFDGEFVEGGATTTVTWDDVPQDMKDLVACEMFSKEEAIAKCSANGPKEQRMILTKVHTKRLEDETTELCVYKEIYPDDYFDEILSMVNSGANNVDVATESENSNTDSVSNDDLSWMDALDNM